MGSTSFLALGPLFLTIKTTLQHVWSFCNARIWQNMLDRIFSATLRVGTSWLDSRHCCTLPSKQSAYECDVRSYCTYLHLMEDYVVTCRDYVRQEILRRFSFMSSHLHSLRRPLAWWVEQCGQCRDETLVTEFAWPLRQRTAQIVLVCSCLMIWTFDCQFDWGFTLSRDLSLRQRLERRGQLKPFWPDESDEHFAKDVGYLSARCENPGWMNDPIGDARFWRQTVSKHSMGIFKLRTKEITVRSLTSHDQPLSIFFNQFRLFFSQMSYGRQVHTNPSVLRKIRLLPARAYT